MFSKIISTGAYTPPFVLTNEMLSRMVDTSDEWIVSRSGIRERRISMESTTEMAVKAAAEAVDRAGISMSDIEVVIGVTCTADHLTPSLACEIQGTLGADRAYCFDINAACTGFVYALDAADAYVVTGRAKNVLIVSSEATSKFVDYSDRGTCVLFGDGAAAAVVSRSDAPGIHGSYLKSEGIGWPSLVVESLNANKAFVPDSPEPMRTLVMNGREVYKFAVRAMNDAVTGILERTSKKIGDLKLIIPHQANLRIIKSVSEKLGVSMDKIFVNLHKYGNMSSASVPMALHEAICERRVGSGDLVLLVGFGAGLTYGSVLVTI